MCSDESLRHFGRMGLLGITNTARAPTHTRSLDLHPLSWGRDSAPQCLGNCLYGESDCGHCVLRNNRITGPEMALRRSHLCLHFADGVTSSYSWLLWFTRRVVQFSFQITLHPTMLPPLVSLFIWACSSDVLFV